MSRRHRRKKRVIEGATSKSGLRFLGATASPQTEVSFGAFPGYIDPRILDVTTSAATILGGCIGNARSRSHGRAAEPKLEILLGLSLLALSEIQSLILLCSAGLERSARIHMRSLYEYSVRAKIILSDDAKAEQFMYAAVTELERLGQMISVPQDDLDRAKVRFLGSVGAPEVAVREQKALGADMRSLIKADSGDRMYGTAYAHPSMISHGSILALDEISRALEGVGNNFQADLYRDGRGGFYLLAGALFCCDLAAKLVEHFHVDAAENIEATIATTIALQAELGAHLPKPPPEAMGV